MHSSDEMRLGNKEKPQFVVEVFGMSAPRPTALAEQVILDRISVVDV